MLICNIHIGIGESGADVVDLFNLQIESSEVLKSKKHLYRYTDCVDCGEVGQSVWSPPPSRKGDVARSLMYMSLRYDGDEPRTSDLDINQVADVKTLLQWHKEDPVDEAERIRNNIICSQYQMNRNPFIDFPALAELLFSDEMSRAAELDASTESFISSRRMADNNSTTTPASSTTSNTPTSSSILSTTAAQVASTSYAPTTIAATTTQAVTTIAITTQVVANTTTQTEREPPKAVVREERDFIYMLGVLVFLLLGAVMFFLFLKPYVTRFRNRFNEVRHEQIRQAELAGQTRGI